jgi:hypothetical protein
MLRALLLLLVVRRVGRERQGECGCGDRRACGLARRRRRLRELLRKR